MADDLAGAMYEFFAGVYDGSPTMPNASDADRHELPIPSPDSITVTTEFGVIQEPANTTTVSASGPSPFHSAYDQSDDENNVEMTEDLHEDVGELQQSFNNMHMHMLILPSTHVQGMFAHILDLPVEVEPEHVVDEEDDDQVNDTGEEADIDTDDLGAESVGHEGVITPTTTVADGI
jgi:hypothetical protein